MTIIHMYPLKISVFQTLLYPFSQNPITINLPPEQDLKIYWSHTMTVNKMSKKTLHKYAINQVTQCDSKPQSIETKNIISTLYSKARATTLTRYKFTATFSEKKVHCSQVSNGNKNRVHHESFYQSNIKRLLHLRSDDCKNEPKRLKITSNKGTNRKLVHVQVFPDSAHPAELGRYQGHIKLDNKCPFHGARGRLTYDLHDKIGYHIMD